MFQQKVLLTTTGFRMIQITDFSSISYHISESCEIPGVINDITGIISRRIHDIGLRSKLYTKMLREMQIR